jgi:hypothetical protein
MGTEKVRKTTMIERMLRKMGKREEREERRRGKMRVR